MSDNYSILQRNTLDGLSEAAGILYLKLCDTLQGHASLDQDRKAFMCATRFDERCGTVLDHILRNGPIPKLTPKTKTELSKFFAERWCHNFMRAQAAI